jgi:hypothetical protein
MKREWRQLVARHVGGKEILDLGEPMELVAYTQEFIGAFERTESFGFKVPGRILVRKDCVDMTKAMPVLLRYFSEYKTHLSGRTLTILHTDARQALLDVLGIPFYLTTGWLERDGKPILQHGDEQIARFAKEKKAAWDREGVPFHIWLTSPSLEILDLTFAMNLGWANTEEECAGLIVYQPVHEPITNLIYHPMLVGDDFYEQTGAIAQITHPAPDKMQ